MQYTWKYVQCSQLNLSWLPFPKQVSVDRKKNTHVIFFLLLWILFAEMLLPSGVINKINSGRGPFCFSSS